MNRTPQILLCVLCALFVQASLAAKPPALRSSRPNIIFISADDMGYGDCIVQLDHWVGEVLTALRETGLEKNTLIVFASDNGASKRNAETCPDHTPNGTLAGHKGTSYEGGHRVPLIVKWPGRIPGSIVSSAFINHTDFFATIAELLEVDLPGRYPGSARDSHSFLPVLSNPSAKHKRPPMVVVGSYRKGAWKLIADGHRGSGEDAKATALYDMDKDLSEKTNLMKSNPEKAQGLLAEYRAFLLARDLKSQPNDPKMEDGSTARKGKERQPKRENTREGEEPGRL